MIGRWFGLGAVVFALTWELVTDPNWFAVIALGLAVLVAIANLVQRHFLVALQATADDTSRARLAKTLEDALGEDIWMLEPDVEAG